MIWFWIGFLALVFVLLALDLGVFHRHAKVVSVREALAWSAVWITLGVSFSAFIYFAYENHWLGIGVTAEGVNRENGTSAAMQYITGYLVEKSLSVDNIFVIAMLFSFFGVPAIYQHRVLYWGILGALVMRGAMIAAGAVLIAKFWWVSYVFGAFLLFTAVKMFTMKEGHSDPSQNRFVRLARRFFPITSRFHGERFFVRAGSKASQRPATPGAAEEVDEAVEKTPAGKLMLTPLALALIVIEGTDLVFAVDSIPAIFGITSDPFLVFTSNVFAIMGLRSLYFALAGMLGKFRYLTASLAVVLAIVGLKMLLHTWLEHVLGKAINFYLLGLILLVLLAGVVLSLVIKEKPSDAGLSEGS